jgi:signal transduction histidine kinase
LGLATLAAAVTLRGVVALSERRGAFVSAVTHELRTPLTTFRMYAEMLAEGMVPSAQHRQDYLEPLRREADRLAHLVENVLQYARLERGRPGGRREEVALATLLERTAPRLADRAEQAEMKLEVDVADEVQSLSLCTDPAAVEQILFNLVDNACKYASHGEDKRIHLEISAASRHLQFRVRDHGPGISRQGQRKLFLPFSKSVHEAANSAPGVGLGLALSRRLAKDLGGSLTLATQDGGSGAVFVLELPVASPT